MKSGCQSLFFLNIKVLDFKNIIVIIHLPMEPKTLTFIMAGGKGERLHPLTRDRVKPAVPFGGTYRIVDFTLSNCLNSGLRQVYVLVQYKCMSLLRHLKMAWGFFDRRVGEFIDIVPAQQRVGETWYLGTADAIYQNIYSIKQEKPDLVMILAGDHIYKMDYSKMLAWHVEKGAEVTVGAFEVPKQRAHELGIMAIDRNERIVGFQEKPKEPASLPDKPDACLASMGIYVFNSARLQEILTEDAKQHGSTHDFGKDIIPKLVAEKENIFAYRFVDENRGEQAYWRDIGTIDAYWEANIDLISVSPQFNLYDKLWPIHTYTERHMPAKTVFAQEYKGGRLGVALDSLVSPGCIISGGRVEKSVLSPEVRINSYAEVSESVIMENAEIGRWAKIRRAIIDKNVYVSPGTVIGYDLGKDRQKFTVSDNGIVVVPKETRIGEDSESEG